LNSFAQHLKLGELNEQLKGSPLYMAPEIVRKHQYDAKADLWSVGVILYECLFGKAPYSSRTIEELLLRIRKAEPIVLPPNAKISNECHDLLRRLLAHEPAERISNALTCANHFYFFIETAHVSCYQICGNVHTIAKLA